MRQGGGIGRRARLRISEIIDFKTSLSVSKRHRFTSEKRVFAGKSFRSRMVSRNTLVLAQILAHGRAGPWLAPPHRESLALLRRWSLGRVLSPDSREGTGGRGTKGGKKAFNVGRNRVT